MEIVTDKTASTTTNFIKTMVAKCPIKITLILTDNGKEFTDRFCANGERQPTGEHIFDKMCDSLKVECRLIPPRYPQTNGMVERFNGRISHVVTSTYFASAEEMEITLTRYLTTYNHHLLHQLRLFGLDSKGSDS